MLEVANQTNQFNKAKQANQTTQANKASKASKVKQFKEISGISKMSEVSKIGEIIEPFVSPSDNLMPEGSLGQIPRPVEILKGSRAIAVFLGIRREEIGELEKLGAPIIRDTNKRLRAEKAELWQWWKMVR